ncbi:forkhead-associated domain-containing protein 1-like [Copidosoma floridanum]|uniref:forkhead-associated domain-containing protein 1-like n=1 Tax=Copidosoma floridanum TaxID=29053 RepID=UPI0006C9B8EF|nr:forkhead-associated domain-containing protein 1-like [Copidosoma floridanum]
MDTLEKSLVCRLCGKHCQISVNIFDKNENHVWKINVILPITVHEMDFLPKQMCHRCSYKLEEFYNFYAECVKTDTDLKNQLSWMRKETSEEQIITPMVKMNPFKIKTEPPDCNDSNSSDVFGHISSYGSYASPILTCSRCRCLCNTAVKVSESPTEVKAFSKGIGKPLNSNVNNNNLCGKNGESSKSEDVNKNCETSESTDNDCSKENIVIEKEINTKEKIPLVVINSSECQSSQDLSDATNRALRPRKSSVNYIGQKKKVAHKLKERFKNKVDICPTVVDPVEVKVTINSSRHSHPVIKLEKVDDTLKNLRARKNLEEFNKKIKELAQTRRRLDEDLRNKFLRRLENRSRKSFQKDESRKKKGLLKEEKVIRKSLQLEEIQTSKYFTDESRKNLEAEKIQSETTLLIEHQNSENSPSDLNHSRKSSKSEKLRDKALLENSMDKPCSTNDILQTNVNDSSKQNAEIQVKQEVVKVKSTNHKVLDQSKVQDKSCEIISVKKASSSLYRLPKYPVVKLEKDYTCNVDYPRVKIKRQLSVADPTKLVNGNVDCPVESQIVSNDKTNKKSHKKKKNLNPENSKRKKKKLKGLFNAEKAGKVSKKKNKGLSIVHIKKGTTGIPSTEFKHFCEECDTCFKNRELFKLHPCYQK